MNTQTIKDMDEDLSYLDFNGCSEIKNIQPIDNIVKYQNYVQNSGHK